MNGVRDGGTLGLERGRFLQKTCMTSIAEMLLTRLCAWSKLNTIDNGYYNRFYKQSTIDSQATEESMYVCLCKGITESQVRELGRAGKCTADELAAELGILEKGCCGRCARNIEDFVMLAVEHRAETLISVTAGTSS